VLSWQHPATLDILDSIEKIAARNDVEWAEPSLVVSPEVDTITPSDFLWPGLWDRQLIGVQNAWQHLQDAGLDTFGDPNILLAVWDSGVQSSGGAPTNTDFSGTLSNGAPKVLAAFDFDNMVANNDSPWDNHRSGVAGVSVALANNLGPVAGPAYGLVGSAPNVQIMTIVSRTQYIDIEVSDQYIWMAGFDPHSPLMGFPLAPPPRGADVITCSLTPGAGAPLSGTARATLDFVTTFGRGGKGTMCFFSTGNANQNNVTARPYGAYEKCFGIAATSFANDGVTEIRAPYSGWGQIALCAPSQDQAPTVHNPPTGFMPWGAAHLGAGNMISFAQSQTTLSSATAVGATILSVTSVIGFAVGSVVHIGAIGAAGSEPSMVTAVNAATNQLTLNTGLLNAHAAGDTVMTGSANHRNNFGGTSSATPLCAGVAALVLSANPALTYIEARQILRDTALKFDLTNTDPVGQWLDANGNPSVTSGLPAVKSGWYGYGRVKRQLLCKVQSRLPPFATLSFVITSPTLALGPLPAHSGTVRISDAEQRRPGWTRALCRLTTLLKDRTRILYAVNPTGSMPGYTTTGPPPRLMPGCGFW
jgi:subtilisin family serine protease